MTDSNNARTEVHTINYKYVYMPQSQDATAVNSYRLRKYLKRWNLAERRRVALGRGGPI